MACKPCNTKKGSKTPDQAGMKLAHQPARPNTLPLHTVFLGNGEIPEPWRKYLNLEKIEVSDAQSFLVGETA
jgi:hypothetical protein